MSDFIKWLISGQAQIDATKLKILALRGAALLLNMALGVVTGLVVSSLIGAITSYTQRIDCKPEYWQRDYWHPEFDYKP